MPPKGARAVVEDEPTEEDNPSQTEEESVEASAYVPAHVPKNPLLFPARCKGRPHMQQVLSSPDLRSDFLGLKGQSQVHADSHQGHGEYRQGLDMLLAKLETQTKKRKAKSKREEENERNQNEMRRAHELFLEGSRVGKQKAAWTYTDAANVFEYPQLYEQGESKTCSRNQMLTGIYDVADENFKPPHSECNVHGGWTYFQTNLRNEQLYEFRDKEWQKTPMSPQELKFKDRLDRSVERMTASSHQDALDATTGYVKKDKLHASLGPHSCLKRGLPPWTDQAVTTHTFFHTHESYKPGDHLYESGMEKYIQEPERAMSYRRNIIAGDQTQKSFWHYPKAPLLGTNRRQVRAQELIHQNSRGATGLLPKAPDMKRKVLLKGTGSLSFTHFKDALVEPTYERFSPGDRSQPP